MHKPRLNEHQVHSFLESLFEEDLHARRVLSLSHAVLGVIHSASLGVHTIGKALAWARGTHSKHGVKQVDRLLSNPGINVWELFARWVPYALGQRSEAVVALDWTDFDADGQTTLMASLVASHGRTTPLVWHTVEKAALEGMRNETEDFVLQRLREVVPEEVRITVRADRGFGDQKFYALLGQLKFDYVVRFRQCIQVMDEKGEKRSAGEWVPEVGAAGESLGMERYLKANTVKTRTYSLFRQGCEYYQGIPMMPESRLLPLMERFAQLLCEQPVFREVFGPI